MIKKIGLGVSAAILAASAFFAAQRVQGVTATKQLHSLAQEAAEVIVNNDLADVGEYQQFIEECNQAIEENDIKKCKELVQQAAELKAGAEKLGTSLAAGQEMVEKYGGYPPALQRISEVEEEGNTLQQQLDDLSKALKNRDADKVDELSGKVEETVTQLNEKLQKEADRAIKGISDIDLSRSPEVVQNMIANWKDKATESYEEGDYAGAYTWAKKIFALDAIYDPGSYVYRKVAFRDVSLKGKTGTMTVEFHGKPSAEKIGEPGSEFPELEYMMNQLLYVSEVDENGNYIPCKITDLEVQENLEDNSIFVLYEGRDALADTKAELVQMPSLTDEDIRTNIGSSDVNISNVTKETMSNHLYDDMYTAVIKAGQSEGRKTLFVAILDQPESSICTVDDVIKAAQMNNVNIYLNNGAWHFIGEQEVKEILEKTGGGQFNGVVPTFNDAVSQNIPVIWDRFRDFWATDEYLQRFMILGGEVKTFLRGRHTYRITYESQLEDTADRKIEAVLLRDDSGESYVGETGYWPESYEALKTKAANIPVTPTPVPAPTEEVQETEAAYEEEEYEDESAYIIPDSSSRYLTEDDVKYMSDWEKKIARNEIYARHGRKFNSEELQQYFNSKDWYTPSIEAKDFKDEMLNDVERYNTRFISQFENK